MLLPECSSQPLFILPDRADKSPAWHYPGPGLSRVSVTVMILHAAAGMFQPAFVHSAWSD